jgi:hypothetical protein
MVEVVVVSVWTLVVVSVWAMAAPPNSKAAANNADFIDRLLGSRRFPGGAVRMSRGAKSASGDAG